MAALAFGASAASSQDSAPVDVRHVMQTEVNPAIVAIWDVTNNALDDNGNLVPAMIPDEGWTQIASSAALLAESAERMAAAQSFIAASPGNRATEEYEVSMDVVQASIDADPAGLRTFAAAFAANARELEAAARARDAARTSEIVTGMDGTCAACHGAYWYPEY
ncbi:MAG: cytochrome c [Alteraurantiacibacter sp.]